MSNDTFQFNCMTTPNKCSSKYDNYILLGDLNFDLLDNAKCSPLNDIMDVFDLSSMVKKPTCFTKHGQPSLLDVILTSSKNMFGKVCNFNCVLSDVNHMIAFQLKFQVTRLNGAHIDLLRILMLICLTWICNQTCLNLNIMM